MAWLEGWSYRKAIIITENSGRDLIDFQVRIYLNNTNFDFTKANADGSDIRITTDDEITLLPYYIEKWDSTNQQAVIWVKVPSIPAGSSVTIYMYYGNPNAVSESDGEAVFDFFDNFDSGVISPSKWTNNGATIDTAEGNPPPAIKVVGGTYAYANAIKDMTQDYIIEYDINIIPGSTGLANLYFFVDGDGEGQMFRLEARDIYYSGFAATTSWTQWSKPTNQGFGTPQAGVWYHVTLKVKGDTATAEVSGGIGSGSYTITRKGGYIAVHGDGAIVTGGYFDNIRVRKYADVEPTCTMGEEAQPYYISGVVTFSDGTPASNCTVVAIDESTYNVIEVTTTAADGTYTISGLNTLKRYTVIVIPADNFQNGDIKCHVSSVS